MGTDRTDDSIRENLLSGAGKVSDLIFEFFGIGLFVQFLSKREPFFEDIQFIGVIGEKL